jgi:hypothetical protein
VIDVVVSAIGADVKGNVKGAVVEVEALAAVDKIEPEPEVHTILGAVTNSCCAGSVSVRTKFLPLCKA